MALPTDSKNLVTVERLSAVIGGTDGTGGLWGKTKGLIAALDGTISGSAGAGKTLTAFSQTDGKVSATFGDISITKSQVSDFPSSMPPSSHTHGNIQNDGTLNDTAAAAAGNDYVVIRDADNNKIQTSTIKGVDVADAVSKKHSHSTLTLSTSAQAYDGTHTLALPSADPYTSARTPTSHASSATTYGVGTTANYGHVKLITGDLNGKSAADGVAAAQNHTHGQYAPKVSPALTGTPTAPTPDASSNDTTIATTAFVKGAFSTVDAMVYKGTVTLGASSPGGFTVAADKGHTYKVIASGTTTKGYVDGVAVEAGDMVICNTDSTAAATSSNYSTIAAKWDFVQGNLDGTVVGPASSVDARIAVFNGTTGKVIKDSGYTTSDFALSSHNHDSVYFKSSGNVTLVSGSATKIGTQNGSDVKLTLPSIPAAANNGALKIGLNGATAASKFTANQSGDSTLTFAEGATNGTIAVDGTDVAVHGLGSAAYTESSAYATSSHTHTASLAADSSSGTVVSLSANTQYKLTAGGASVIFKTPANPTVNNAALKIQINGGTATSKFTANASSDATLTFATGGNNGTIKVDGTEVAVKGLGSAAYTASTAYATHDHTHDVTIAADSGISALTMAANTKYKLTAGEKTFIFTTPPDNNTTYTPQELGFGYGTCGTAESTAAKAATLTGYTLVTNGIVAIKFTYAVPASATLNINSTGAKNIFYRGAAITAGVIGAGDIATFIYDGTQYQLLSVDSGEQEMTNQEVTDLLGALT